MRHLILAALFAATMPAQPKITSIVNGASFQPGIAYDGFATIFGTGFSDAAYQAASIPWPYMLGKTQVVVCSGLYFSDIPCLPVGLTYVGPTQINFQVPLTIAFKSASGASLGPTSNIVFSVIYDGVPDIAYTAHQSTLTPPQNIAPGIFLEGYDCLIDPSYTGALQNCGLSFTKPSTPYAIRGSIADLNGRVLSSSNPAHLNQYYVLWMTGLGDPRLIDIPPTTTFRLGFADVPVFGYAGKTNLLSAVPTYMATSPQYPGLWQINFQLPESIAGVGSVNGYPPLWPCGSYNWEITVAVTVGEFSIANPVQVPIAVRNGEVQCAQ